MIELFYLLVIFILAIFVGYEIITKVPPTLHTPLMSGTNAISGIIIIGALILLQNSQSVLLTILGVAALTMATINVVGGFLVTQRMLSMFVQNKHNENKKQGVKK
jgi:NAD(P) transhydrogenase subunit alpha